MIARLQPGISQKQAEALLNPAFRRAAYEPAGGKPAPGERATSLHLLPARGLGIGSASFRKPLTILQIMVGVLLLIACGNVSMLLVVRNAAREREFGVRLALGGSRGRLLRQLFTESFALVAAGALLGWLFAEAATRVLAYWSEIEQTLAPDSTVLWFTVAVSVAAGLILSLAPLRSAARLSIAHSLKTSGTAAGGSRFGNSHGKITAALQMALCLMLLSATGLLVRTLQNLESINLGMKTDGLIVFGIDPQNHAHSVDERISFFTGLTDKLRSLPQVKSVTLMGNRLGSEWSNNTGALVDGKYPRNVGSVMMRWNNVGPDFFATLGVPLVQGRDFNQGDSQNAPAVAIVNRTFAEKFFKGRNPMGHTVSFWKKKQYTVVGIVADSKYANVEEEKMPMAYFPYTQIGSVSTMHVELRTTANAAAFLPQLRKEVAGYAPDLALLQPLTQQAQFDESIASQRLVARLAVSFAVLAILLVSIGLYGTISYNVTRRTNELGLRMALGAERGRVLWMILRESLIVCGVGLALGVPLSLGAARALSSLLYGVTPNDPLSISAAVLGIIAVGVIATLVPARRAASINPMQALRHE